MLLLQILLELVEVEASLQLASPDMISPLALNSSSLVAAMESALAVPLETYPHHFQLHGSILELVKIDLATLRPVPESPLLRLS